MFIRKLIFGTFTLGLILSLVLINYDNISIENNEWQYIILICALLGYLALYLSTKIKGDTRLVLSQILFYIFIIWVVLCIIAKIFFKVFNDLPMLIILSGMCGLIAMYLTIKDIKNKQNSNK